MMTTLSRRRFFAWLGGTAAGAVAASTLDLDKLLWVPGERRIFIPTGERVTIAGAIPREYNGEFIRTAPRYELSLGGFAVGAVVQVQFDQAWQAVRGVHLGDGQAFTAEELANLSRGIVEADTSKLAAPFGPDGGHGWSGDGLARPTPDRFAEVIRSDMPRSVLADAESRPFEFTRRDFPTKGRS